MNSNNKPTKQNKQNDTGSRGSCFRLLIKKHKIALITATCVIALLLAASFVIIRSKLFAPEITAVKIGNSEVTAAVCNYYVKTYKEELSQTYGASLDQLIDLDKPLDRQSCPTSPFKTWADRLFEDISQNIQEDYAAYNAAMEEGYSPTQEDISAVENYVSSVGTLASSYGFSSIDDYLKEYYGHGCSEENYREYRMVRQVATKYTEELLKNSEPDDEDVQSEYAKNYEKYDTVSFRSFFFSSKELGDDKALALATEFESEIKSSEDNFISLVSEYAEESGSGFYSDPDSTLTEQTTVSAVSSVGKQWLIDRTRKFGDSTVVPFESYGYYVYFFIEYEDHNYPLVNLIHIFVSPEDPDDKASWNKAQLTASELYDKILENGGDAKAFSQMAVEYSDSPTEGQLNDIYKGRYSETLNDWCFKKERKIGDSAVVRTDSGYQIVFLDSFGQNYRDVLVSAQLSSETEAKVTEILRERYPVKISSLGYRFITF